MQEHQWQVVDEGLGCALSFLWADFGQQILVWVSDGARFDSLDAAVPAAAGASATTVLAHQASAVHAKGEVVASRLCAAPLHRCDLGTSKPASALTPETGA